MGVMVKPLLSYGFVMTIDMQYLISVCSLNGSSVHLSSVFQIEIAVKLKDRMWQ
jgi:hypothetical protein